METLTSFTASTVPRHELSRILVDYLALDRARIRRRSHVARFGLLALLAVIIETLTHTLSLFARLAPIALLLVPPARAWLTELRLEVRLARRLKRVEGVEKVISWPKNPFSDKSSA